MTASLARRRPTVGSDAASQDRAGPFRGDIEGLRAVAVVLVLLDHAGLPITGGFVGVDVFFVISGFLISSLLLTELRTRRRISLREFYGRRARRLLPGAAVVLIATAILTVLFIPKTRWLDIAHDILGSTLYVENWRLAALAVDYQAQSAVSSPLQHFWSLSVEEQFYIVWPLLLLGVAALRRSRRFGLRARDRSEAGRARARARLNLVLTLAIALVAVPSLAWSIYYTGLNPAGAYFVTTTRLWELAVGALVAIQATRISALSPRLAAPLGWLGLALIAICAVVYDASTAFPGIAATGPVLGTAAVLAAGQIRTDTAPATLLNTRPMRWVGKLSYSLYLWHWPLLSVLWNVTGQHSAFQGSIVVVLSIIPAYLCFRFVEDPARRSTWLKARSGRSLVAGGVCTGTALITAFLLLFTVWPPPSATTAVPITLSADGGQQIAKIGAMVLADNPRDDPAGAPVPTVPSITPDPLAAKSDLGDGFCITALLDATVSSCTLGDTSSAVEVALIGDSHAQQWATPLGEVAAKRHWKLTIYTKAACPFLDQDVLISADSDGTPVPPRTYSECTTWRNDLLTKLAGGPPLAMAIVSSGEHIAIVDGKPIGGQASTDAIARGYQDAWGRLQARGTRIVALADTPTPNIPIPDCVAQHPDRLTDCTVSRQAANAADGSGLVKAARAQQGVSLIDLSDAICPTERCAPVIGGVMVWRDSNHMSASYSATLAPRLDKTIPPLP